MKDNLHEVDKTQRSDGFWIWFCSDDEGKEWATYLSREADPETTLHGHYFVRFVSCETAGVPHELRGISRSLVKTPRGTEP